MARRVKLVYRVRWPGVHERSRERNRAFPRREESRLARSGTSVTLGRRIAIYVVRVVASYRSRDVLPDAGSPLKTGPCTFCDLAGYTRSEHWRLNVSTTNLCKDPVCYAVPIRTYVISITRRRRPVERQWPVDCSGERKRIYIATTRKHRRLPPAHSDTRQNKYNRPW